MFHELAVAFGLDYAILVNSLPKELVLTVDYKKNHIHV
jgi:hypothetical protein